MSSPLAVAAGRHHRHTWEFESLLRVLLFAGSVRVVVKTIVPFWVPIVKYGTYYLGYPKRGLNFDNYPYVETLNPKPGFSHTAIWAPAPRPPICSIP